MGGTPGWAVSWTVHLARTDGRSNPADATRRGYRCRAAGSRLRRRSGLRTAPGSARRGRRSVRRHWSGTSPRCTASARGRVPGPATSRRPCGGRCGGATRVVAATSTATAAGAADPAIGWRSTTSCRSRSAALPSCPISGCAAERTTGCGTLSVTPTPRACRLRPGAHRSSRAIPGSAGGTSDRMRRWVGPGRDRATGETGAPACRRSNVEPIPPIPAASSGDSAWRDRLATGTMAAQSAAAGLNRGRAVGSGGTGRRRRSVRRPVGGRCSSGGRGSSPPRTVRSGAARGSVRGFALPPGRGR